MNQDDSAAARCDPQDAVTGSRFAVRSVSSGRRVAHPLRRRRLQRRGYSMLPKLCFAQHSDAELFRFLQFAPGLFAGEHEARFLAHAAADFSAARDNHLRDLFARLAERAGDHPGVPLKPGDCGCPRVFSSASNRKPGLPQFLDQLEVRGSRKKS